MLVDWYKKMMCRAGKPGRPFAPWRFCASPVPYLFLAAAVFCSDLQTESARAQDASLLLVPPAQKQEGQATLENSSFMYRKLPPEAEQRELQINDLVTVLVDYRSSMISEGDAEARKVASINAVLSNWLKFDGNDIFPAPQSRGDPRVSGSVNSQFRAESEMELRDALMFKIAAAVVDIRPNGNLVIEARREIRINEEVWIQSLTGVISRKSIGPDRTVTSDQVHELRIEKRERGFVNDSYSRGWLGRWYDKWKPF
jgi:flagellar L-ring protein precursor FlgH